MKEEIKLKKSITWIKGAALTVGAVLGSGILVLPAIAAEMAGPASILSWILMGLFSLPMVITIGMMSSKFPNSGGLAAYARQGFGDSLGELTGILILSAMPIGMPVTALIGANYLGSIFSWSQLYIYIAAGAILVFAIILNYRGIELLGKVQVFIISVILFILILTVTFSSAHISISNFHPFISNGLLPIGQAMNLLFFAFMGWEMIGHLAEEFNNPRRDIPLSLGAGYIIVNLIYISIAFVTIGNGIYSSANSASVMIKLVSYGIGKSGQVIVALLGFIICYCTVHTYISGFSRLVYSEARDGKFPALFGKIHPKYQTPYTALLLFIPLFLVIMSISYIFSLNLKALIGIPSTTFLAVYIISMLAAAKVLLSKKGKVCALIAAFLALIVFLFAGWSVLYPLLIIITFVVLNKGR